jgi:hypothetical protein
LAAVAADRAAPFAKRAGEVTSDASGKLATKSRIWAADVRASMAAPDGATSSADAPSAGAADVTSSTDASPDAPDVETAPTDGPTPA